MVETVLDTATLVTEELLQLPKYLSDEGVGLRDRLARLVDEGDLHSVPAHGVRVSPIGGDKLLPAFRLEVGAGSARLGHRLAGRVTSAGLLIRTTAPVSTHRVAVVPSAVPAVAVVAVAAVIVGSDLISVAVMWVTGDLPGVSGLPVAAGLVTVSPGPNAPGLVGVCTRTLFDRRGRSLYGAFVGLVGLARSITDPIFSLSIFSGCPRVLDVRDQISCRPLDLLEVHSRSSRA